MKYLIYITTAFFLITSHSVHAQGMDKIDSVILDCLHLHYAEHNIDLDNALDTLESQMVEQGIIRSSAPEDIHYFYQNIATGGSIQTIQYTPIMDSIIEYYHFKGNINRCVFNNRAVDSLSFANSNYQRRQLKQDSLAKNFEGSLYERLSNAILKASSLETFSTPLYRAHFLLSTLTIVEQKYLRK
jgi:hypothetical protein